jgi:four helix bundle protein
MPNHDTEQQLAWERTCPAAITSDVLWTLDVYRASMYLIHLTRGDRRLMRASRADLTLMSQLIRAVASISANLAEGYSRSTRPDRLRFLDYALGSARECIPWYEALRDDALDAIIDERMDMVARVRSMLLGLMQSLRKDGGGARKFKR